MKKQKLWAFWCFIIISNNFWFSIKKDSLFVLLLKKSCSRYVMEKFIGNESKARTSVFSIINEMSKNIKWKKNLTMNRHYVNTNTTVTLYLPVCMHFLSNRHIIRISSVHILVFAQWKSSRDKHLGQVINNYITDCESQKTVQKF